MGANIKNEKGLNDAVLADPLNNMFHKNKPLLLYPLTKYALCGTIG